MIDLAWSCVALTQEKYTFCNAIWQRQYDSSAPILICIHTRSNILHESTRIYKHIIYAEDSHEQKATISFRRALEAHSWRPTDSSKTYTAPILRLTNADIKSTFSYTKDSRNYSRAVLVTRVNDTNIQCVGRLLGRHGDGNISSRMYGCFKMLRTNETIYELLGRP